MKNGRRQSIKINDDVVVSDPDFVVMDGVVHEIDTVLMPPLPKQSEAEEDGESKKSKPQSATSSWLRFLPWNDAPSTMTVEEIMERLQPYIDVE